MKVMKYKITIAVLLLLAVFSFSYMASTQSKAHASVLPSTTLPHISQSDILQAGFAGAIEEQPGTSIYVLPNLYFKVNENTKDAADDLVMVSEYTNGSKYY